VLLWMLGMILVMLFLQLLVEIIPFQLMPLLI